MSGNYKFGYADIEQKRYLEAEKALSKKTRATDILTVIALLAVVFGFAIAFFVIPDKSFSENENRTLKTMPKVTLSSVASGKFTSEFSEYFTDQFPARESFISLKAVCELALGKMENNGVIAAKDGYLIKRFDPAALYSDYRTRNEGKDTFSPSYSAALEQSTQKVTDNADAIVKFAAASGKLGIPVVFAAAGRLSDVAPYALPAAYPADAAVDVWDALSSAMSGADNTAKYLDLRAPLKEHFDAGEYVYFKTDHHWTALGAYYGYSEIMKAFGEAPTPLDSFTKETVSRDFIGTTWSSSGLRWTKPDELFYLRFSGDDTDFEVSLGTPEPSTSLYDRSYLDTKDKYSSFISENRARIDITATSGEERERILVIKDSFALALVPFLAERYDITMIDLRYYRLNTVYSILEAESIDKVLLIYNMDSLATDSSIASVAAGIK